MDNCNGCRSCEFLFDPTLHYMAEWIRDRVGSRISEIVCSNNTQTELIAHSGRDARDWIDTYSEDFRKLWSSGIRDIETIKSYLY